MRASILITAVLVLAVAPRAAVADDEEALTGQELATMRRACEGARPACDPVALLSRLERAAVDRAMSPRHLEFDRAPAGKRIGHIYVVDHNVFGPGDGPLRLLNVFHVTTRPRAVLGRLVFEEGDRWDQRRIDESARHLRDPISTSLAAIVPIASGQEGVVDVLVVTRDVWSIRLNSIYEIQAGHLTYLSFSFSENNLLGLHKLLALSFEMDQGAYSIGPLFRDDNLLGRHIDLYARAGPIFNRQSGAFEGTESSVRLSRPLWALSTRWGASLVWSHTDAIERHFQGNALQTYDAPETPGDDQLPYEFHMRQVALEASGVRAYGDRYSHQVKAGYVLGLQRPSLLADFPATGVARDSFVAHRLPRSERASGLFVGWQGFDTRYRNFQYVDTFELAEDVRMGPQASATATFNLRLLGSEANFIKLSAAAGYTGSLGGDGMWRASLSGSTRLQGGQAIDDGVEAAVRIVSPTLGISRLVSQVTASALYRDHENQDFTIGGDNGLRGYAINAFLGDRRLRWQTELRTRPVPVLFTRWGLILFDDLGGSAASFRSMTLHHDVGVGLRGLIPQLESNVFRADLAVSLDRDRPGVLRLTVGFEQSF